MTLTLVDWLQNSAIALLLAWVVLLSRRWAHRNERVAGLEAWGGYRDPEYWRERLGRDPDAPLVNDEPEPDVPIDCKEAGKLHVAGPGSNTCQNCPAVLV